MTLSEVSSLLPPPEGMEWRHYDPDGLIAAEDGKTVIVDPEDDNRIRVSAWNGDDNAHLYTIPTDPPSAYLRALTAVGLAPDAEKEDLRRRLTWTSEVPTQAGAYAVTWANKIDSDVYGWTRFDGGTHPWQNDDGARSTDAEMRQHGARFLPLANLKEPR